MGVVTNPVSNSAWLESDLNTFTIIHFTVTVIAWYGLPKSSLPANWQPFVDSIIDRLCHIWRIWQSYTPNAPSTDRDACIALIATVLDHLDSETPWVSGHQSVEALEDGAQSTYAFDERLYEILARFLCRQGVWRLHKRRVRDLQRKSPKYRLRAAVWKLMIRKRLAPSVIISPGSRPDPYAVSGRTRGR